MTWEEAGLCAFRGGEAISSRVRSVAGEVCVVDVALGGETGARGEGRDLFGALVAVRRLLDAEGVRIACNGARLDVFPSAMLRQSTAGRRAYVLALPRTVSKPTAVDIFAAAPEGTALATVDEQRAWFDDWRRSAPEGGRRDA